MKPLGRLLICLLALAGKLHGAEPQVRDVILSGGLPDQPGSSIGKIRFAPDLVRWLALCGAALVWLSVLAGPAFAAQRSPENQVFQFATSGESTPPDGLPSRKASLYLWIPERCERLRGLVILGNNVPEHMLVGHAAIRGACRRNDLGLVWSVPTFWNFAKGYKGRDDAQVAFLDVLLEGLAGVSGYEEVTTVPWLPIGESGHLLMVVGLLDERPERCIAGICVKNPHYPVKNRDVPLLWMLGTGQEWGQKDGDLRESWDSAPGSFTNWGRGREGAKWPLSILIEPGTGHFYCSDAMAEYFGEYIDAALSARLGPEGLVPTDLNTGFVAHLPLPGIPGEPPVAYSEATADQRKGAWFFTEKLAAAAQRISRTNWDAATSLPGFVAGEGTTVKPFSFNSVTEVTVTTDGVFDVDAEFLPAIPEGFKAAGAALAKPATTPKVEWICGPFAPTGDGHFRIALDRTWKTGAASYMIAKSDGDATTRPAVQPAAVKLLENMEGAPQKITFEPIGDLKIGAAPVPLRATSDSGLPVEFSAIAGPAAIREGRLELTPVPPRSKFPVEIKIAAWQWGSAADPKVKTSEMVTQTILLQKP